MLADGGAVLQAGIPAGGGGLPPAQAGIPAGGAGGGAAAPADAAPTAEQLELQRYGAPADIPEQLVSKFLELARSPPPKIEFLEGFGLRFAHQAAPSLFSRYGWCLRPVINDRQLFVRCIFAKNSGDGVCGKMTLLSRWKGGKMEIKLGNAVDHLASQHKRQVLDPNFIVGALPAEPGGEKASKKHARTAASSGEVDKLEVEDYKDRLLTMAIADACPLGIGDRVGFRTFAQECGLPYVSRSALDRHFTKVAKRVISEPREHAVRSALASKKVVCGPLNVRLTIRPQA